MNAERFVRSLIVAAACVVTGWWLLHDSTGEDGLPPTPTPHDDDALEPRAADSGDDAAIEVDARDDQPVAEEHSADAPAVLAAAGSDAVEPIPLIEGITSAGRPCYRAAVTPPAKRRSLTWLKPPDTVTDAS